MKVMFCHDGSEKSRKSLDQALDLFKAVKPEIILLTVYEGAADASMENEEIFEKWRNERHDILKAAADYVTQKGFDVDAIMATGDPRRMILEASQKKKPDILIVSKRGGGLVENMVLGSVSAYIVRHAKCPVLVFHS